MSDCKDNVNGCKLHQFQRNSYFYGKLMTVRDFEDEQSYMNEKRHLLNRSIHGAGIVCGFENVSVSAPDGGEVSILFQTGGVALDCCGREIVVPDGSVKKVINEKTGSALTKTEVTAPLYIYLEYKPCYGEMVHAASNPSSCDETCCPNRIIEDFEVIASQNAPETATVQCPELADAANSEAAKEKIKEWLKNAAKSCPECDSPRVFLKAIKSDLSLDPDETKKFTTYIPGNKNLFDLLTCHVTDFLNPHKTTAQQVGALVSIDGVKGNPQGNVDLVKVNSITISPDDTAKTITIGETHSGETGNPHHTKHFELADVQQVDPSNTDTVRDKHVSNADANRWNSGGAECKTGLYIFRNVPANIPIFAPPVNIGIEKYALLLSAEITDPKTGQKAFASGDALELYGIKLGSLFDEKSGNLLVGLVSTTRREELKVRGWAIKPTKDLGELQVVNALGIITDNILENIKSNTNITAGALMSEYNIAAPEFEEIITPLIESGKIKVTSGPRVTGRNRTFMIKQ